MPVLLRGLTHRVVPRTALRLRGTQLPEHGGPAERHVVLGDEVGTGKVPDDTGAGAYPHVADERDEPGDDWDRGPHYAVGVALAAVVHGFLRNGAR